MPSPNSLFISRAVSYFCETEFGILAGFGPAGSTENVCDSTFEFFLLYFHQQNKCKIIISVHFSIRSKKLINIKVRKL